jgi:hypothetical protein
MVREGQRQCDSSALVSVRRLLLVLLMVGTPVVPAVGAPPMAYRPILHARIAYATGTSANWAGYAVSGVTFTDVRASWKQPSVRCLSSAPQASSFWVGLDGYAPTSTSVEQIGTDSDCDGLNRPQYYAWYEVVPAPSVPLPAQDAIHAGDTLSANVRGNGTVYTLELKDWTAGWHFSTQQTAAGALDSSAEWVAEAPSTCSRFSCRVMPLADFGTVTFANAAATSTTTTRPATISTFSHDKIVMVTGSGLPKARPSTLTNQGTKFTVGWVRT